MRTLLRAPLLHFLLLGGGLVLLQQVHEQHQARQVEAPGAASVEILLSHWRRQHGRDADAGTREALIRDEIDRRILIAEAHRRDWHRRDPVVLRRLLANARFLGLEGSPPEQIEAALALDLSRRDPVIRRRLEERMRASVHPPPDQHETPHWERRQAAEQALIAELRQRYRVRSP